MIPWSKKLDHLHRAQGVYWLLVTAYDRRCFGVAALIMCKATYAMILYIASMGRLPILESKVMNTKACAVTGEEGTAEA